MNSGLLPGMEDTAAQAVSMPAGAAEKNTEKKVSKQTKKSAAAAKRGTRTESPKKPNDLDEIYRRKIQKHVSRMPWLLRITDHRDKPSPVVIVKYRRPLDEEGEKTELVERGTIYGDSLRRCLPSIRQVLSRVRDENDVHLDLHQFIAGKKISFRGNLPLDQVAGAKLGLLFKLQQRVKDLDRVELMAARINNFTGEEASYWLSRISYFGSATNRWAAAGMRIMLGGQPGDPAIAEMLRDIDRE